MRTEQQPGLPINLDTERGVLACILLDASGDCYLQAAEALTVDEFGLDSHRRIFGAMLALGEESNPIDYLTLCEVLDARKEIEACGGIGYITDLTDAGKYIRLKNIQPYIDILREFSRRRTLALLGHTTFQAAIDGTESGELLGELQGHLDLLTQRAQSEACVSVAKIAPEVARRLIKQHDQQEDFIGLPTGIRKLDKLLSGLVKGENIVVAADTGAGKTSFALNVAEINCLNDNPVQVFSLEMKRDSLLLRLAAGITAINHLKFRNGGWMSKSEMEVALKALGDIAKWPLWIDDTGGLTPRELYARGRMQVAKGAKLIIVDYLQKLNAPGNTLRERVTNASEAVRQLAKHTNVPVLNLSQLSRPERGASKRKPGMHDLKESGSIEQDAHSVVLLWREEEENEHGEARFTEHDLIIVGKNRSGPTGEIKAKYDARIMHWYQDDTDLYDGKAEATR